ncbi:MAG: T9SS type A sorting domain-containing protein [Bacteroidales bacterium]
MLFKNSFVVIPFLLLLFAEVNGQNHGCTDTQASNYDPEATINDGSCQYPATSLSPVSSQQLPSEMVETSGLIFYKDRVWTHNDDTDIHLYAMNPFQVNDFDMYPLEGVENKDWEDIAHDQQFIYVGDFGNNSNGNRTDLRILRIDKNTLKTGIPTIDTIAFSYELQNNFDPTGGNNTDFDCEAMIVGNDSIFLFTKQWVSEKTALYALPKTPGEYTAKYLAEYDVNGLITGATYMEQQQLIALVGYSSTLNPFMVLLYDFENYNFFNANVRRFNISLPFHQVEGITTHDGLSFFISNERFSMSPLIIPQKLHEFDLTEYLNTYVVNISDSFLNPQYDVRVFPVPAQNYITLQIDGLTEQEYYQILDIYGNPLIFGYTSQNKTKIDISAIPYGVYYLIIKNQGQYVRKIMKTAG